MNDLGRITNYGNLVEGGRVDRDNHIQLQPKKFIGNGEGVFDNPFLHDSEEAGSTFGLRSLEFGKWLSENEMANFLYASSLGLHQLARIFHLKNAEEIGFNGRLSLTLGARGQGGTASAHFESLPYSVINITKPHWSVGALAHEYGHAFDNILSYHIGGKKQSFVTGGRTTRKTYDSNIAKNGNYFEKQFEKLFNGLYWHKNGTKTSFLEALEQETEYYQRRTEVWARTVEVYVYLKLKQANDKNNFLVGTPKGAGCPQIEQIEALSPLIAQIFSKGFLALRRKKTEPSLNGIATVNGYMGFRKTIKNSANINDTLKNMKRIALRDSWQVKELAESLEGNSIEETAHNIWDYIRENITYQLDRNGIEELRSPSRTIHDKKGDCDDYTILASAILLELNINHIYKVAAYQEKGKFQHIYPVAIDEDGTHFIIDVVPEIPHFNYEAKPIIDLKIVTMELQELSGLGATGDAQNDFANELNQPFTLSGFPEMEEDESLEDEFLSGLGEVDNEEDADIVLSGNDDIAELIERGFLAEVNKAKLSLLKELSTPSVVSQTVNVKAEIETLTDLMDSWEDEDERNSVLSEAIASNSAYANFYQGLQIGLDKLEELAEESINGLSSEDPIYLARINPNEVDLSELDEDDLEGLGLFRRKSAATNSAPRTPLLRRIIPQRIATTSPAKGRLKTFVKKLGATKIGKIVKKVAHAVVKYNPATVTIRAGVLIMMKTNLGGSAAKLIYGYLTPSEAQKHGLDHEEWNKIKNGLATVEKAYVLIGGDKNKLKNAIVKGRAKGQTGVTINGLGIVAAAAAAVPTAAAAGWLAKVGGFLKKVNFKKMFTKVKQGSALAKQAKALTATSGSGFVASPNQLVRTSTPTAMQTEYSETDPLTDEPMELDEDGNPIPQTGIINKVKAFFQKHKKAIIATGLFGVVGLIGVIVWKKVAAKKKRQLSGVKAARTRKRNQNVVLAGVPRKRKPTTRRRKAAPKSTMKALGNGYTTVIKAPSKNRTKTRTNQQSSGDRLSLMHAKAKQLQKKNPKTKYSTLLSRASKMI